MNIDGQVLLEGLGVDKLIHANTADVWTGKRCETIFISDSYLQCSRSPLWMIFQSLDTF